MNLTMEKIIHGFAEIEAMDVRVGRVDVPRPVYDSMLSDVHHAAANLGPVVWPCADWKRNTGSGNNVGTMWGADLNVKGNRIVVYPEGWHEGVRWGNLSGDVRVRPLVLTEFGACPANNMLGMGLVIHVKSHSRPAVPNCKAEWMAQETLRESLPEGEWKRYVKNGFLCVRGASGRIYQVPAGRGYSPHVKVWEGGRNIAEICLYIKDRDVPPTDRVLAFKAMIEADESEIWRRGNVFKNVINAVAA